MEQVEEVIVMQRTQEADLSRELRSCVAGLLGQELIIQCNVVCHAHVCPACTGGVCRPGKVGNSRNVLVVLPSPQTFVRRHVLEVEHRAVESLLAFVLAEVRIARRTNLSGHAESGILLGKQLHHIVGWRRLRVDG